jgi:hypothetical protein
MKELTIEEKSKAYDKALSVAQETYATQPMYRDWLEKMFPELKESKDERIMKELIKFFRMGAKYNSSTNGIPDKDIIAWLEKQNKQKPAWSEDDEGICRAIINDIANDKSMCTFDISKGICDEQINWLKSLKERVACEANCTTAKEWSKEDEIWIDRACMLLDELNHLSTLTLAKIPSNVNDIISHLKSIKDRYTWKPSNMELEVLRLAAEKDGTCLMGLYKQLKKLREE